MQAAPRILVVYAYRRWPIRTSVEDHLSCFERYAPKGAQVHLLNVATRGVPRYLRRIRFDLIVFHTLLLGARWRRDLYERFLRRAAPLKRFEGVKIALPQDEFLDPESVERFVLDFGVSHVFSVMPETEWPRLYPGLVGGPVRLHRVLTGYLDERSLQRIASLARLEPERTIDIGYRAWQAAAWLGRHGRLKVDVGEALAKAGAARGLRCDVSTSEEETLYGDDWYRFLLRCRYTVGVDGGASILDRDGSLRRRTEAWLAEHPGASFEEVEAACFPGRDGEARLIALSPRHLEACATRTCQVLVEGDYNGVLEPDVHYIPLASDLANADEVAETLGDEERRRRLVERAHRDVVDSGAYSYRGFVAGILDATLPAGALAPQRAWRDALALWCCRRGETMSWWLIRLAFGLWRRAGRWLPLERLRQLRRPGGADLRPISIP